MVEERPCLLIDVTPLVPTDIIGAYQAEAVDKRQPL